MATTGASPISEFDAATAVDARDDGMTYAIDIDAGWTVAEKPNGGYLLATLARAAGEGLRVSGSAHRDALAATAHYLWAPDPGAALVRVTALRLGRSASQVRATLTQDDRMCVEATFTMGTLAPVSELPWWTTRDVFDVAPYEDCIRIPAAREGSPFVVPIMDRSDLRLDPAVMGFAVGAPSGDANLRGWISFADGREVDPLSLLFFLDALPPATFELVQSGWVPTLSLTAYLRARPMPGPLRISQSAHAVDDGRVDETCEIYDVTGRLVGQSSQLAAIRIPDGAEPPQVS